MVHEYPIASREIFVCAQAGCERCLARLLAYHERMVHALIRQSWRGACSYEELVQEGRIALWRALRRYQPERGVAFVSYAWPAVQRQLWEAVARSQRRAPPLPLPPPASDPAALVLVAWEAEVRQQALAQSLAHLPVRERLVLVAAYGLDGWPAGSFAAIGRALGYSRERIRQLHNDALVTLRLPPIAAGLRPFWGQTSRQQLRAAQAANQRWLGRRRGGRP